MHCWALLPGLVLLFAPMPYQIAAAAPAAAEAAVAAVAWNPVMWI